MRYRFLKGHGTENDFVLLPDPDGTVHGALSDERVRALCDRRAGIGGDGVLRVIRSAALARSDHAGPQADHAVPQAAEAAAAGAEWFMDYRNADGSIAEMCGNGVRVFARHLLDEGLAQTPIAVGTRAGIKVVTAVGADLCVDMGEPQVLGTTVISVFEPEHDRTWPAAHIDMGNPHAVAFVDDLAEAGTLLREPAYDCDVYPRGVNIEFVTRVGDAHVAMRVHERGAGETRSCGTGACAVAVAVALADGADPRTSGQPAHYRVDLPGGTLQITWTAQNRLEMTGPAVVVAEGSSTL